MKRKSETSHQVEAKIPSLSTFLKEENLNVDEIETDVSKFLEYYNEFLKHISEISDKKEKANPTKVASIIIKFKELNRKAQFRLNISRDKTKETKDAINKNHLAMQNLLYEALHLEKETNSCLEFKSLHEDIDLVPIEEFMQVADESLKNYETEHELTLNRLYWELNQRKNLSTEITNAEEMEKQLQIEISKKRQAYNEISSHLKAVFDTTKPLETIFDLPMHRQDEQNELVELLPEPLYVLYLQMKIQADLDSDDTVVELVPHGAIAEVVLKLTVDQATLVLQFCWDSGLELVTVYPSFQLGSGPELSILSSCFVDSAFLLSELPGDAGCPMKSPWIRAKLDSSTISSHSFPSNINSICNSGIPYLWCQRISGMFSDLPVQEHPRSSTPVPVEYETIPQSIATKRVSPTRPLSRLIVDIRDRVKARLQLVIDIDSLSLVTKNRCMTISNLTNWSVSSYSQFKKSPESAVFIDSGLSNEQCFVFTAVIRSSRYQDDEIPLWILIPHNYPLKNPIFILSKSGKIPAQEQLDSLALVIHLLEVEVNCFCDEFLDDILNRQINRLLMGVDILLDYLHNGSSDNKLNQILIGNKFPVCKRPFRSN